ncbi:MAG: DUF1631 domain-containing protein [Xanthomonadaceae bacterium]|nr:DUF1631 domain-containing protein [Xanthomonadaceae bacterium]
MTTSSQAPTAAFQSCVDEVLRQSAFLIDRWSSKLVSAMYERSLAVHEPAERHQIQAAIAVLKKNRLMFEQGFSAKLKKAIADDAAAGTVRKSLNPRRSLSSVSFDELELMGDNQVQEAVESARLQQLVRLACESGLAGFSARLSTAQGFLVVKGDSNPLRPEVITLALIQLLQSLPVSSQTRACWLLDGAGIMGEELQALYVLLNDFLAGQGIEPAAYGVVGAPQGRTGRAWPTGRLEGFQASPDFPEPANTGYGKPEVVENDSAQASRKPLLTLDHLHHLLVGDYENSSHEPTSFSAFGTEEFVHQDFSHTVPAALDVLTELEEKGLVSARTKLTRPAPSPPVAQLRARLKTDAKTLGQSLAIEVVGLMIEQMANDERLLAPVRQVIASIEPAFLRLAVTDPRFFSDKTHPARKLLETITSASLGYASENAPGFSEFMQNLQKVAVLLAQSQVSDAQHFAELLQDFERRQNRNTPEHRQAQRLAVQALLQAEQRNLMAAEIANEIRARPDFVESSRTITAFLTGPWAQVMARERLAGQSETFGTSQAVFSLTLGDVLWSLDIAPVASHQKRLLKMIPDMLQSLRQGLASIDFPVEQSRPFFDQLMAVHRVALKARPEVSADAPKKTHVLEKMFAEAEDQDVAPLWMAPSEAQHSGFMEDWDGPSVAGEPRNDMLEPQDSVSAAISGLAGLGESIGLNLGDWVDLLVDMQWLRAQLTWISPRSTLFMFTSEGGRKHSMTSHVLRHLLKLNLVKVISQQGVFEGALDSVARTAMQNSVQRKGG